MPSNIERADRVSRARALIAPFLGVAMLSVQQWLFFGREWDALSPVQLGVWALLALGAMLMVMTGGLWFVPREIRRHADDDGTRLNRLQAIFGGFFAAMIMALIVFVVSPFEPLDAQRAAHIILSMGLGVSLVSFGFVESRALA